MIKHNPLNFKVGDTAYLDGNLECTIQSISDKGMFCVVISPLYSTPYEVMTNRLLRGNVLKDTSVHVKLKQHLDSITPEQFNKEIEDIQQELNTDGPTMEEFICRLEDCPHCAYELQEEFDDDDMLTDDEWLIREKHKQTIEFGEWLISSNWSYFDSTEKGNVYVNLSITDALLDMEQVFEIFLKEKCK